MYQDQEGEEKKLSKGRGRGQMGFAHWVGIEPRLGRLLALAELDLDP